ncbi:uncharacterized protein M6B38_285220 [Iris pallida]|uniref:Glutaredoxin-like protein n=1 Tax=Iris pallida TaxID=29817 RepID=A0AAX6I303_IRIPA|nr:uncharacterized protein M6B38_285220 [Iris pallida]
MLSPSPFIITYLYGFLGTDMAAAALSAVSLPRIALARRAARSAPTFCSSVGPIHQQQQQQNQRQLVLYTKPGCCLCDGLKEKLHAALSLASLHSVNLQVRNILENPEWERLYQYEIPVLAKLLPDGTEETLPRLSPRLRVELIQKKIEAALEEW